MKFYYLGHYRLALGLYSPNLCAAILACLLIVTVGLLGHYAKRRSVRLVLAILALFEMVLLGLTYSRGGYLAAGASLGTAALLETLRTRNLREDHFRWKTWLPLAALFLVIVFLPAGGKRAAAIFNARDLSVLHRLFLWRGGTMLIAERPWSGYPAEDIAPGDLYSFYYQPLGHEEHYGAFLNDFLNLALNRGLPAASLCLTLYLAFILTGLWLWKRHKDTLALYLSAALVSLLLSSCTSNLFHAKSALSCLALLCGTILFRALRVVRPRRPPLDKILGGAFGVSLGTAIAVYLSGVWFLSHWYYRLEDTTLECAKRHAYGNLSVPRPEAPKAIVLTETLYHSFRTRLLPLVAAGFNVYTLEFPTGWKPEDIRLRLQEAISSSPENYVLVATGQELSGAVPAILEKLPPESQPAAVLLEDVLLLHPMPEYSLENYSWSGLMILFQYQGLEEEQLMKNYPKLHYVSPEEDFAKTCKKLARLAAP